MNIQNIRAWLGMACVIFGLFHITASAQQAKSITSLQKLPPNVKVRPMTAAEIKKIDTDALAQAQPKAGAVVHINNGMTTDPALRTLQQQKMAMGGALVHAPEQTAASPTMLHSNGPTTLLNSTTSAGTSRMAVAPPPARTIRKNDPHAVAPAPVKVGYVCHTPLISDVNHQAKNAVFTPAQEYNSYVIKGCSFGTRTGQIYLTGKFNALKINLQPTYWNDTEIDARVDPTVAGELDQDNVTLVVAPVNAAQIKAAGFRFYAARSNPPVLLTSIRQHWAQLARMSVQGGEMYFFVPSSTNPYVPKAALGASLYLARGTDGQKFAPGSDFFDFRKNLAPGWRTDTFQLMTFDSPPTCGGVVTYRQTFGTWHADQENGNIRVNWAETSCSGFVPKPPIMPLFVMTYTDQSASAYALKVWARGPRCTDPQSGQPIQQCIQNVHMCGKESCGH